MKNVLFFGFSGHAKVVRSCAESSGLNLIGYFEQNEIQDAALPFLGTETNEAVSSYKEHLFFAAIGSNAIRRKIHAFCDVNDLTLCTIQDSSAVIASEVSLSRGTLIAPGAIVNSGAHIEEGCIVNSGAIVEHDSNIGAFSHLAPGSITLGGVTIGENCFIGAGAVLKEGITIASDVIIGAGSVVIRSIHEPGTWVGNPAKKIR